MFWLVVIITAALVICVSIYAREKKGLEIIIYIYTYKYVFRKPNFVDSRGLWSPEPEERQIRSSSKQGDTYSISLEGIQTSQNERQASATSSTKSENSSTKKTDANQSFGFSSFRQASHELERLQKEARELARRKAEKEHAEELSAPDGTFDWLFRDKNFSIFFFLQS